MKLPLTLSILLVLIACHLSGPGLVEAPVVTDTQKLERKLEKIKARNLQLEMWWIRAGHPELIRPGDFR